MNAITRMIWRHVVKQLWPILVGLAVWIAALFVMRPDLFGIAWARVLLLFAPLVLVPLGLPVFRGAKARGWARPTWRVVELAALPAAVLFAIAFLLDTGWLAALLASPWLMLTGCLAVLGAARLMLHRRGPVGEVCLDLSLMFLFVGSIWALFDRLSLRPLDFEETIVLLTAIHFHYAGYVLPLITAILLQNDRGRLAKLTGLGVIAGIPLVALGITATQLRGGWWLEILAAWVLGGAGLLVAWLLARQALESGTYVRLLWLIAAVSLAGSMVLAITYGSRGVAPVSWLDIPWMRALHGTANALGFALCGLLGVRVRQVLGM